MGESAFVFGRDDQGKWRLLGTLVNIYCSGVRDGIRGGEVATAPAQYKEIVVNGYRLSILPNCTSVGTIKR